MLATRQQNTASSELLLEEKSTNGAGYGSFHIEMLLSTNVSNTRLTVEPKRTVTHFQPPEAPSECGPITHLSYWQTAKFQIVDERYMEFQDVGPYLMYSRVSN